MDGIPSTSGTLLKDAITKNYTGLCNAIDCKDAFLTLLHTNDIITQCLMSEVKSIHDNTTKAAKILDFLKDCRTDTDFSKFVDILKTSGYSRAVDLIMEPITLPSFTTSYGYQGVVAGYIERQELQQQALAHLTAKPNRDTQITCPVVVLPGFGGNGKSQMARRLVQILTKGVNDSENMSVWINAVSETSVIEGFRNFANVAKEANASVIMKKVYERKDRNLLLVFDDGDDFEMLKTFLPLDDTETNVRVIITAHSEWACGDPNVKNIPVTNFNLKEFRDFSAKAVSRAISGEDAKQLEGHTGRIPAILSLVCKGFSQRFKRDPKYTIAKHFAKYGKEIFTFGEDGKLVPGLTASDYKKSAKIVVEQQLACMGNWKSDDGQELIDLAKYILNCLAYCDPVYISEEDFFKVHPQILRKANGDYGEIRQAIGLIKEFGWIELVVEDDEELEMIYSMHACYQIGLKSQLNEHASESILHGMIEYMQAGSSWEKDSHLAAFWSHISSHSQRSLLLNHAAETSHCLVSLAEIGLMDEFKSLASVYQGQGKLVHALLQDVIMNVPFLSSPMFYLFRYATDLDLVKYFILEIKAYYDHLEDLETKAWIRHQLLRATTGAVYLKVYETVAFTLDTFDLNVNECPYSLIHSAAGARNSKFVELLIKKGANVDQKNERGETPLHKAVGNFKIVKALIEGGANVNEKNVEDETSLHEAILLDEVETAKFLVEHGANIHELNGDGETPLHFAVYFSNLEVVKLLIEKGAKINEKNVRGDIPLHIAIDCGETEIVKFLVENGADIYELNRDGDTPLQLAVKYEHKYIVDYLISINQSLHNRLSCYQPDS